MTAFDLAKTQQVESLFAMPREHRDDAWIGSFYATVPDASMAAADPQVFTGPDGFPYFGLHLPPVGQSFDAFSVNHVLPVCTDNGFGCVIGDRTGAAGWVFTYGNLWSLRTAGTFDARPPGDPGGPEVLESEEQALIGSPTDELLPPWARAVLRQHLGSLGIAAVKVALVVRGGRGQQVLALTVGPDQIGEEAMRRLTWFFPPHIGFMVAHDEWGDSLQAL